MRSQKISFQNNSGVKLSAKLELPADRHPYTCAIFAHCFTCSKNLGAARNISSALTTNGIAVLRFDFTGLGDSEGAFEESNFSTNIEDLLAAAAYLETHFESPSIFIGHSLGGAAVVFAASQIPSIQAVATIGAPADPEHVQHLLKEGIDEIEKSGEATVDIGGRPFKIKKQFLEDIRSRNMEDVLKNLRKAILVLHSPQDKTVSIGNAAKIYNTAFHPKSFISLDGADHLLSDKKDSLYAGEMIASWVKRYVSFPEERLLKSDKEVVAQLGNDGYKTEIKAGRHGLIADEPLSVGGTDLGPSPYQLLSAALGACTVMTMQMYARRKKWDLQEVTVHIDHSKDYVKDCEAVDNPKSKIDHFDRELEIEGDLSDEQKNRLLEIADRCPVHKTLHSEVVIKTTLRKGDDK